MIMKKIMLIAALLISMDMAAAPIKMLTKSDMDSLKLDSNEIDMVVSTNEFYTECKDPAVSNQKAYDKELMETFSPQQVIVFKKIMKAKGDVDIDKVVADPVEKFNLPDGAGYIEDESNKSKK